MTGQKQNRRLGQPNLPERVLTRAKELGLESLLLTEPLVVGVSGGADSLALLYVLAELRPDTAKQTVHVAHLNHGFRGDQARADANFVRRAATSLGLAFTGAEFDVPRYARSRSLSAEEAARQARYAFLAGIAQERGATVAVAHTANDQVETVLMHMLRGSGVHGLAGMAPLSQAPLATFELESVPFAYRPGADKVRVFRPLLSIWRTEIEQYLREQGLIPRLDSTNASLDYRRNRVRHELLPVLLDQFGLGTLERIYDLSRVASAEDALVEKLTEAEWVRLAEVGEGEESVSFHTPSFATVPAALQRRLARKAIGFVARTLEGISFQHIESAAHILAGDAGCPPGAHLPHEVSVQRSGQRASVRKRSGSQDTVPQSVLARWPMLDTRACKPILPGHTLELAGGWALAAAEVEVAEAGEPGALVALFDAEGLAKLGALEMRGRRPGDFIRPLGMRGAKSLQDLFIDAKIPREARSRLALVCLAGGSEVLWAPGPGGRRAAHAPVTEATRRVIRLEFARTTLWSIAHE